MRAGLSLGRGRGEGQINSVREIAQENGGYLRRRVVRDALISEQFLAEPKNQSVMVRIALNVNHSTPPFFTLSRSA